MTPLLVFLLCLPVAAIGSMVGVGGGTFFVPLWLATGLSFAEATSVSLVMITALGVSASAVYLRHRLVDPLLVAALGPSAWALGFLSGMLTPHLDERMMRLAFGGLLVPVALLLFRRGGPVPEVQPLPGGRAYVRRERGGHAYAVHVPGAIAAGGLAGLLSGLFGVGGGIVVVPILTLVFHVPAHLAVATSTLLLAVTSAFGAAGHAVAGHVPWGLALGGAVAVVIGSQAGARVTTRLDALLLKRLLGGVLLIVAAWVEVDTLLLR